MTDHGPDVARLDKKSPFSVEKYWERRYVAGGNSGAGSYGVLANYKAAFINRYVKQYEIGSAIDFGCGDGHQIALLRIPAYLGLDISAAAVELCKTAYSGRQGWSFQTLANYRPTKARHDLALSLDVVYHLVEDAVYEEHMSRLFAGARRHVVIYGSDWEEPGKAPHIRHRCFSAWVAQNCPEWKVVARPANPYPFDPYDDLNTTFASFVVFRRDVP